jgi:hypothetical protein
VAVAEFGSIMGYLQWGKSGQTRILAIGEFGDRPREHCIVHDSTLMYVSNLWKVGCFFSSPDPKGQVSYCHH